MSKTTNDVPTIYESAVHVIKYPLVVALVGVLGLASYSLIEKYFRHVSDTTVANAVRYLHSAKLHVSEGRHTEAIEDYSKSLLLIPDTVNALRGRGVSYMMIGEMSKAIADLDSAINKAPRDAASWYYRGGSNADVGKIDDAIIDFES